MYKIKYHSCVKINFIFKDSHLSEIPRMINKLLNNKLEDLDYRVNIEEHLSKIELFEKNDNTLKNVKII